MELILTEDVFELGRRGQIVTVANGYGRNYLIPKRLAILATDRNKKVIEQQKVALAKKESQFRDEAALLGKEIDSIHIIVSRKAGESGVLFGSVTAKDVAEALKRDGIALDRRKIQLDGPIKTIGNYQILVRLHSEVEAHVLLSVVIEGDKPVLRLKRKDAETDRIVGEVNAKVKEIGLTTEGRVVTERFGPEPVEEPAEGASQEGAAAEGASAEGASAEAAAVEPVAEAPAAPAAAEASSVAEAPAEVAAVEQAAGASGETAQASEETAVVEEAPAEAPPVEASAASESPAAPEAEAVDEEPAAQPEGEPEDESEKPSAS